MPFGKLKMFQAAVLHNAGLAMQACASAYKFKNFSTQKNQALIWSIVMLDDCSMHHRRRSLLSNCHQTKMQSFQICTSGCSNPTAKQYISPGRHWRMGSPPSSKSTTKFWSVKFRQLQPTLAMDFFLSMLVCVPQDELALQIQFLDSKV